MVVEFTTNLIDSSYLGCPMVFKQGLKKNKHAKKKDFSLFLQKKYTNILKDFLFETVWKDI